MNSRGSKRVRFRRTRLGAGLAASLLAGLLAATPAYGDHGLAKGSVAFVRGTTLVSSYLDDDPGSGTGTNQNLNFFMSGRDYGRFVRWCDATVVNRGTAFK